VIMEIQLDVVPQQLLVVEKLGSIDLIGSCVRCHGDSSRVADCFDDIGPIGFLEAEHASIYTVAFPSQILLAFEIKTVKLFGRGGQPVELLGNSITKFDRRAGVSMSEIMDYAGWSHDMQSYIFPLMTDTQSDEVCRAVGVAEYLFQKFFDSENAVAGRAGVGFGATLSHKWRRWCELFDWNYLV